MHKSFLFLLVLGVLLCWQCAVVGTKVSPTEELPEAIPDPNPPAAGFSIQDSDPKAIALADSVMWAMGGRKAWDETRYISWNFFGVRDLLWDKHTGRVRIDVPDKKMTYLININTDKGAVFREGEALTQPDSIAKYISQGKSIWINDAYWLAMPFKLKDSGVTLQYEGMGENSEGSPAHVLRLTFDGVGDTPQNKYQVYVDPVSHLVNGWAYYRNAADTEARFNMPWLDYLPYGKIRLSGNRGERQLNDIAVYTRVPDVAFSSPAALNRENWE